MNQKDPLRREIQEKLFCKISGFLNPSIKKPDSIPGVKIMVSQDLCNKVKMEEDRVYFNGSLTVGCLNQQKLGGIPEFNPKSNKLF